MASRTWQDSKEFLASLVSKLRFGLFSDLDGTLSPIAPTPEAAQITTRNRELLTELQKELPLVALISGRRADSLQARVGLPGLVYIGNHGLEQWIDGEVKVTPEAQSFLPALQATKIELQKIEEPGVYVEDKGPTLSLHYRQAADPIAFTKNKAAMISDAIRKHGLRLFPGKMVFEVRPPIDMDKGNAFELLVREHSLESALFLGDDVSDLNALKAARKMRANGACDAWGVAVQSEEAPEDLAATADFLVAGVKDVEALLAWVLKARRASST